MVTRREFLDTLAVSAVGLAVGSTAKSYGQIMGSNDRLNFAVIGLNGRAYAHLSALKANKNAARIAYVCDVDSNILKKFAAATEKEMGEAPATDKDFRHILEKWTRSRLPPPTTGMLRWRLPGCRRARTSM
jgi:hypothetical protein